MDIGEKRTEFVNLGDAGKKAKTGRVVWIHPKRIFYVVEFEFEMTGRRFREAYFFPGRGGSKQYGGQ